jgi:hypothetical protein
MIKVFMPMSGNLGDTLSAMPVISGIYKSIGQKIHLVVRDRMKIFNGLKEFLEMQDCIYKLNFESEVNIDNTFNIMSLVEEFEKHQVRPWETVRLDEYFKSRYNFNYDVDDDFTFQIDENITASDKFLVGDRMFHADMDQRRNFNVLESSGKFATDKCLFLDYNLPMKIVASFIKNNNKPLLTTFTGISTIADLLKKEMFVFWGEDIRNFAGQTIEYSYNKHFYRNRKSKLIHIDDFNLINY